MSLAAADLVIGIVVVVDEVDVGERIGDEFKPATSENILLVEVGEKLNDFGVVLDLSRVDFAAAVDSDT